MTLTLTLCCTGKLGGAPQVLEEMLMGKRVELSTMEGSFWRGFGGEQSPSDLETALQLVFQLFRTRVQPVPAELATCLRCCPGRLSLACIKACLLVPTVLAPNACREPWSLAVSAAHGCINLVHARSAHVMRQAPQP